MEVVADHLPVGGQRGVHHHTDLGTPRRLPGTDSGCDLGVLGHLSTGACRVRTAQEDRKNPGSDCPFNGCLLKSVHGENARPKSHLESKFFYV